MTRAVRIGTRGSALALWQANHVREQLKRLHGVEAEIIRIRTAGDQMQTGPLVPIGSEGGSEGSAKGIFIKEIEDALLSGAVDIAVHSMKDVPTETPGGLVFSAITRREDPRDCLISRENRPLKSLPAGARVGTSSIRRQAQLRHLRPDFQVLELRGNVDTRMRKLAEGEYDAIVLAMAGVNRLGFADKVSQLFKTDVMLPAVGQGALGIETRASDTEASSWVAALDDRETRVCITAERALLRELEGGCQVPLGALARIAANGRLEMEAGVFSPDGNEAVRRIDSADAAGSETGADELGKRLARTLIDAGADRILRLVGRSVG